MSAVHLKWSIPVIHEMNFIDFLLPCTPQLNQRLIHLGKHQPFLHTLLSTPIQHILWSILFIVWFENLQQQYFQSYSEILAVV